MSLSHKTTLALSSLALVTASLFPVSSVLAQGAINTGLSDTATAATLNTGNVDVVATIATYIKALLGLVGVVFLVLAIYAGVLWMTARGNEDHVTHAVDILKNAFLGLALIFLAYAITNFLVTQIIQGAGVQ